MKKVLAFFAVLGLTLSFTAVDSFAGGNTGCGFGTTLLKGKKGKVFEILAVTTNGTSFSQTFAISSGTSGYSEGSVIGMNDTEIFIAKNMDNLATDIARGEGEYVNTLASMMKASDTVAFKAKLKNNFNKIYPASGVTSKEVAKNIQDVMKS